MGGARTVGVDLVPGALQPNGRDPGLECPAYVASRGRHVHQRPVLVHCPPVDRRVWLVDAESLGGERHVVVDQGRGGGAGEEVMIDVGEQADPPLVAQGGQPGGVRRARAASRASSRTSASTPSAGSPVEPEVGVRRGERAAGRTAPRLPRRAVALGGLVAGIPGVVQLEPRDRPAVGTRKGVERRRRRPTGSRSGPRRGRRSRPAADRSPRSHRRALRTSSTGCSARRSVPCWICWRHDTPVAATTVSSGSARTAGKSRSSPTSSDTS